MGGKNYGSVWCRLLRFSTCDWWTLHGQGKALAEMIPAAFSAR